MTAVTLLKTTVFVIPAPCGANKSKHGSDTWTCSKNERTSKHIIFARESKTRWTASRVSWRLRNDLVSFHWMMQTVFPFWFPGPEVTYSSKYLHGLLYFSIS